MSRKETSVSSAECDIVTIAQGSSPLSASFLESRLPRSKTGPLISFIHEKNRVQRLLPIWKKLKISFGRRKSRNAPCVKLRVKAWKPKSSESGLFLIPFAHDCFDTILLILIPFSHWHHFNPFNCALSPKLYHKIPRRPHRGYTRKDGISLATGHPTNAITTSPSRPLFQPRP